MGSFSSARAWSTGMQHTRTAANDSFVSTFMCSSPTAVADYAGVRHVGRHLAILQTRHRGQICARGRRGVQCRLHSRRLAMRTHSFGWLIAVAAVFIAAPVAADDFSDAIAVFKKAGESGKFFAKSYGYAVFPNIGK